MLLKKIKTFYILLLSVIFFVNSGCGAINLQKISQKKNRTNNEITARSNKVLILWNGEDVVNGGNWATAKNKEVDTATIEIDRTEGYKSNASLKFQAAGKNWMGFGWNWLDNWKPNQGQDISSYKNFNFYIKIEGPKLPKSKTIYLQLADGFEPNGRSLAKSIIKYTSNDILNGKWHKIKIPLYHFENTNSLGAPDFDLSLAREFSFAVDSFDYVDFDIKIDNIFISK